MKRKLEIAGVFKAFEPLLRKMMGLKARVGACLEKKHLSFYFQTIYKHQK
jgi:hypothetical protein